MTSSPSSGSSTSSTSTTGPSPKASNNCRSSSPSRQMLGLLESFARLLLRLFLCLTLVLNLRLGAFLGQPDDGRVAGGGGGGGAGSGRGLFVQAGSHMRMTQRNNHANISELLDNLLRGYDNSIRPDFGGAPATVEVDIMVRSMGPISEVDMTYSMDCYFRQSWVDKRLAFEGAQDTLALSVSMLARIWKPDTYFYNGKQSYLHTITTPNKFVRIYQNGRVLYSSRLTIKAGCPMNLADFPMDIQRCPLKFGSFGYTTADVIYRWNKERPAVAIAEDMKLSQFDLVDCPAGNLTDVVYKASAPSAHSGDGGARRSHNKHRNNDNDNDYTYNRDNYHKNYGKSLTTFSVPGAKKPPEGRGVGLQLDKGAFGSGRGGAGVRLETSQESEYSMLMVNFHLQRHMGNFLIQVYGPCCLLVVLSWVSFWLNREATADRVSLGITTVLTMTFLGLEARTDLPKVPYPTALDFFVFLSFAFIFATILQFAVVHYFTKYGSGECYFIIEEEEDQQQQQQRRQGDDTTDSESEAEADADAALQRRLRLSSEFSLDNEAAKIYEVIPLSMCAIPMPTPAEEAGGSGQARRDAERRRRRRRRQDAGGFRFFPCFGWACLRARSQRNRVDFELSDEDDEEAQLRSAEDATPSNSSAGRRRMSYYRREELEARRKGKRTPQYNSVSKIDRASRVVFPLLFFLINVFYWCAYLSRSSRILTSAPATT